MRICILGSTGSIGSNALEVIKKQHNYTVVSLAGASQINKLCCQAMEHKVQRIVVADKKGYDQACLIIGKGSSIEILMGEEGLNTVAAASDTDCVINALSGLNGLASSITAIKKGKKLLLANKETLVAGGEIIMKMIKEYNCDILPLDSEHNAILRCLPKEYKVGDDLSKYGVKQLWLTASGGPFLHVEQEKMAKAKVKDACNHPTWSMGSKISIDSATMMNKGLEIIEAQYLFGISPDKIKVVVHPQSIVHCLVEFEDGSFNAQFSHPDMKITIHQALNHPHFRKLPQQALNPATMGQLDFEEPNSKKFPCLNLARRAASHGCALACALNGADNEAVVAFLQERISFTDIPKIIENTLDRFENEPSPQVIEEVINLNKRSAEYSRKLTY